MNNIEPDRAAPLVGHAIRGGMNAMGREHGCRQLSWSIHDGGEVRISGYAGADHQDIPGVLAAWAALLQLQSVPNPTCPGTTEYRGVVAGLPIEVWGVTDRDTFENG